LNVYFSCIVGLWVSEYNEYQNNSGCTKPFGVLWIIQFTLIVIFQIFYYLEEHFYQFMILMALERDLSSYRKAQFRATVMLGCILFTFIGILSLTILGCIWFVQDGECLSKLADRLNSELKMAFWPFASVLFCTLYGARMVTVQLYLGDLRQLVWGDHNGHWWTVDFPHHTGRSRTASEVDSIHKFKMSTLNEMSWFVKTPLSVSQISVQMSTLDSVEVPTEEIITICHDLDLKQDKNKPPKYTCAICQEDFEIGGWYKKLPKCMHCFHAQCID